MENTQQVINDYIINEFLGGNSVTITPNENLIEEGIIDSLAMLRLIQFMEKQFSISIEPEDVIIENFESLDSISSLVESKMKSN